MKRPHIKTKTALIALCLFLALAMVACPEAEANDNQATHAITEYYGNGVYFVKPSEHWDYAQSEREIGEALSQIKGINPHAFMVCSPYTTKLGETAGYYVILQEIYIKNGTINVPSFFIDKIYIFLNMYIATFRGLKNEKNHNHCTAGYCCSTGLFFWMFI